jgi:hypothetical protein
VRKEREDRIGEKMRVRGEREGQERDKWKEKSVRLFDKSKRKSESK